MPPNDYPSPFYAETLSNLIEANVTSNTTGRRRLLWDGTKSPSTYLGFGSEYHKLIEAVIESFIPPPRPPLTDEEKEALLMRHSPKHRLRRRLQATNQSYVGYVATAVSLQAPPLNSAPTEGDLSLSSPRWQSVYWLPVLDWRLNTVDTGIQNQGMVRRAASGLEHVTTL